MDDGTIYEGVGEFYTSELDNPNGIASICVGDYELYEHRIAKIEVFGAHGILIKSDWAKNTERLYLGQYEDKKIRVTLKSGKTIEGVGDWYTQAIDNPKGIERISVDDYELYENEIASIEVIPT